MRFPKAGTGMIAACCLLCGCALRSVYIPISQNSPLFDSAKELRANLYLSSNHIELQAALHPARHISLATNLIFGSGITVYDAALGYSAWQGRWRGEVFGGFGYNTNIVYPGSNDISIFSPKERDYEVRSLYQRYYVQPALGFVGEMKFYRIHYSFGLSARMSALHFNEYVYRTIDKAATIDPNNPVYIINKRYTDKWLFALEPCLTNRVAYGRLYANLQLQTITPSSSDVDVRDTKFSPGVLFSIGAGYELRFVKKKVNWTE